MIFDAHLHQKHHEDGGFLIGLEGMPHFDGTYSNREVLALHDPEHHYYSFYYVTMNEAEGMISHPFLKYHPRREHYSPRQVSDSIQRNNPGAVIIDTLNEPYWVAYDYWKIAAENPGIPFIMAHSGGYLINEFIKICHFQPNVWIDFALTHTTIGKLGDTGKGLQYIHDAIKYSLNSVFQNRVLLSSDFPFFDQDAVFAYYKEYRELLNSNFLRFAGDYLKRDCGR